MSGQPIAATDPVDRGRESPSTQEAGLAAPTVAAPSGPAFMRWLPRFGVWAWSFVGFVVVAIILVSALGAVSEIVLPMTFAAVLAIIFKPAVGALGRHGVKPTLAAGIVVLGLLLLMTGVVVATVRGVTDQMSQIGDSVDAAVDTASTSFSIDPAALEQARAAAEQAAPAVEGGFLTHLVSGVSSLIGLAGGLILGAMIMYYLLKDGASLRRGLVARIDPAMRSGVDGFIGDACRILREYGRGRTVMSAIVSAVIGLASLLLGLPLVFTIIVVNFIGGYIPYIGAFLGGGLAVIIALGDGGAGQGRHHAPGGARVQPGPGELRRAEGDGPHPRHPPACRSGGHRLGRAPGRHRRSDARRAVLGDRHHRHRPASIHRSRGTGGRPGAASPATAARLTRRSSRSNCRQGGPHEHSHRARTVTGTAPAAALPRPAPRRSQYCRASRPVLRDPRPAELVRPHVGEPAPRSRRPRPASSAQICRRIAFVRVGCDVRA